MNIFIIGQGYVGFDLAKSAAASGYSVIGYDLNQSLVDSLKKKDVKNYSGYSIDATTSGNQTKIPRCHSLI
jgi:UDP-N-acetyl-D-mannosaminuronate dehydrogenase